VPYDDIFMAGVLGLMQAAHAFDPTHGGGFLTFAHYHIRKAQVSASSIV
jgi:DNA-directed RNA polymerase specialized sigma subunit